MRIFLDILTKEGSEDEMFSDAFPFKEVDNIVYEVDCRMIVIKQGAVDIGANPSAEDAEEALEDGAKIVNDVADAFGLIEIKTGFNRATYLAYIRGYMKAISAHLKETKPDELAEFQKNAKAYVDKIAKGMKQDDGKYRFFTGASQDPDGMVALLDYREDGITPYFIFWKHGLKAKAV